MQNELLGVLRSVPDVIWSGLIASVLALGGVLIIDGRNTKRLKLQLEHDANEKAKERTATLRREVYLPAMEELVNANAHLASLPQLDLSKVNAADGLREFFGASAKLQLVAEPKTAVLANELTALYGELVLKLVAKSVPLQMARTDIGINDDLCSKASGFESPVAYQNTKHLRRVLVGLSNISGGVV
jgi:hypothetical protein